jgi:membrane associated rhomboid family serine protease
MRLTLILIAFCVIGYSVPFFLFSDMEVFYNTYGSSADSIAQRPYVLVTSIFMHGSLEHLLSNVLVLLFFGLALESELGWKRTAVIFFLGALAGSAITAVIYPPDMIGIGASAGIFALIGVGLIIPAEVPYYTMNPMPLAFLGIAYAVFNAFSFVAGIDPEVSYIAHFAGMAAGLAFGAHIMKKNLRKNLPLIIATLAAMIMIPLLWIILS